jgi:deazaflavin-dependent oxidoreductase (nitroreductase family)
VTDRLDHPEGPGRQTNLEARLMRLTVRPRPLATRVTRLHAWILRHASGRFRRSWLFAGGRPVAALTTTGRQTGQPRSTPVTWFYDRQDIITVAMYLGMERDPDWCLNLQANPQATIMIEGKPVEARATRTTGEDRSRLWARWLEIQPVSKRFEAIAHREIPVFRLTPNALPEGAKQSDAGPQSTSPTDDQGRSRAAQAKPAGA